MSRGNNNFKTMEFEGGICKNAMSDNIEVKDYSEELNMGFGIECKELDESMVVEKGKLYPALVVGTLGTTGGFGAGLAKSGRDLQKPENQDKSNEDREKHINRNAFGGAAAGAALGGAGGYLLGDLSDRHKQIRSVARKVKELDDSVVVEKSVNNIHTDGLGKMARVGINALAGGALGSAAGYTRSKADENMNLTAEQKARSKRESAHDVGALGFALGMGHGLLKLQHKELDDNMVVEKKLGDTLVDTLSGLRQTALHEGGKRQMAITAPAGALAGAIVGAATDDTNKDNKERANHYLKKIGVGTGLGAGVGYGYGRLKTNKLVSDSINRVKKAGEEFENSLRSTRKSVEEKGYSDIVEKSIVNGIVDTLDQVGPLVKHGAGKHYAKLGAVGGALVGGASGIASDSNNPEQDKGKRLTNYAKRVAAGGAIGGVGGYGYGRLKGSAVVNYLKDQAKNAKFVDDLRNLDTKGYSDIVEKIAPMNDIKSSVGSMSSPTNSSVGSTIGSMFSGGKMSELKELDDTVDVNKCGSGYPIVKKKPRC